MHGIPTIYLIILTFAITAAIMPLVIKFAYKLGAVDQPDNRKVHKKPMPRLGGLAIYLAFMVAMIFIGIEGGRHRHSRSH